MSKATLVRAYLAQRAASSANFAWFEVAAVEPTSARISARVKKVYIVSVSLEFAKIIGNPSSSQHCCCSKQSYM